MTTFYRCPVIIMGTEPILNDVTDDRNLSLSLLASLQVNTYIWFVFIDFLPLSVSFRVNGPKSSIARNRPKFVSHHLSSNRS